MNRRSFLAALAGATLDPERLLWRPGQRLISIPTPQAKDAFAYLAHAWGIHFGVEGDQGVLTFHRPDGGVFMVKRVDWSTVRIKRVDWRKAVSA